jgi:hypothetical protein
MDNVMKERHAHAEVYMAVTTQGLTLNRYNISYLCEQRGYILSLKGYTKRNCKSVNVIENPTYPIC